MKFYVMTHDQAYVFADMCIDRLYLGLSGHGPPGPPGSYAYEISIYSFTSSCLIVRVPGVEDFMEINNVQI